ncbi:MAG: hypothetical protein Q9198_000302 [Flavoplaca austrocitrina]
MQHNIFCWKDYAVYGLYTDLPETGNGGPIRVYQLFDRGYRAWFPRRSTDRDISDGSFWGIFTWLRLRKDEMTGGKAENEDKADVEARVEVTDELAQVWAFHEIFCEQMTKLAAEIDESKAGRWELRQSSTEVIMIVAAGWEEAGVRLTRREDPRVKYARFAAGELRLVEQGARGGFWKLRCPLGRAIRIVASRDPERRGRTREEWNYIYEETLIDVADAESYEA